MAPQFSLALKACQNMAQLVKILGDFLHKNIMAYCSFSCGIIYLKFCIYTTCQVDVHIMCILHQCLVVLFTIFTGLFNISDKLLMSIDILLKLRESTLDVESLSLLPLTGRLLFFH